MHNQGKGYPLPYPPVMRTHDLASAKIATMTKAKTILARLYLLFKTAPSGEMMKPTRRP